MIRIDNQSNYDRKKIFKTDYTGLLVNISMLSLTPIPLSKQPAKAITKTIEGATFNNNQSEINTTLC